MIEKRLRPRSLERYPEEVRVAARKLFLEFAFIKEQDATHKDGINSVMSGEFDDTNMLKMAAFMVNKIRESEAGVRCHGCGSGWTDEHLMEERERRADKKLPDLISCCPERKPRPVYWCEFA